jgi:hypothetical protein
MYIIAECPSIHPTLFPPNGNHRRNDNIKKKDVPLGETTPGKFLIFLLHAWVAVKSVSFLYKNNTRNVMTMRMYKGYSESNLSLF